MSKRGGVIHIGCSPSTRLAAVGYIVAPGDPSRILPLKTDAGSALEQMVLAEFCVAISTITSPADRGLRAKLETLMDALAEQFGTAAEFADPKGGIFLGQAARRRTPKLAQASLASGVAINPGPEWSTDKSYSKSRMRLCFASPSHEEIRQGVAALAEVCRREFGVPARIANVEQRARA
jgi:2-aminoadipate transaminase